MPHKLDGKVIQLDGQVFSHLTVLRRQGTVKKYATWLCRCTCGTEIEIRGDHLRRGIRKTCARNGHFWSAVQGGGMEARYPAEYATWKSMRERCKKKKGKHYRIYGKRGIKVCERWQKSFAHFLHDMGCKPDLSYTIDRYPDNNGNYEPTNCRWATKSEQGRNTRRSVYVEQEGVRTLLIDVTEKLGLNRQNIYGRLKNGWSLEDALSIPTAKYKKKVP